MDEQQEGVRKEEMSALDVRAWINENREGLIGARIQKAWQIDDFLLLQLHIRRKGTQYLVLGIGKVFLTSYALEKPSTPSNFAMAIRKHLKNSRIREVKQHNMDRVVIIETDNHLLIGELMSNGNVILADKETKKIWSIMIKQIWKSRELRVHAYYSFPPEQTYITENIEEVEKGDKKVVVVLATHGLGRRYAKEVLRRAGIEENRKWEEISKEEKERIKEEILKITKEIESPKGYLYVDEHKKEYIAFSPIPLKHLNAKEERRERFNDALDNFFFHHYLKRSEKEKEEQIKQKKKKIERKKINLQNAKERLIKEQEEERRKGELLYLYSSELQQLIEKGEKTKNLRIISDNENEITISIEHEGKQYTISLDKTKSIFKNAEEHFNRSKRMRKRLEDIERMIKELEEEEKISKEEYKEPLGLEKRKKKEWYEKFRYFFTSTNKLCIAGRDATTNEIAIKKHTEKGDVVFHIDMPGSPFALLKTKNNKISEEEAKEIAQFTACYSKAWQAGIGAVEVFYVKPEQVSKKAPSGEYMSKGSFMIYGKRKWIRAELKLAAALINKRIIIEPEEKIKKITTNYITIKPGNEKSKEIAKKIIKYFLNISSKEEREYIKDNLKEIEESIKEKIPYGKGSVGKVRL